MKNLFKTCRLARDVLDQFDSLPGHLTEDLHLFSLSDLSAVRNGELAPRLRELLKLGSAHVAGCVLCQAKGFVCEFCGNDKDIIFPFQLNKCTCCEGEPPLLVGGLGVPRAPSPSPFLSPSWRNWKFRRLARALSQDKREGEGGEEEGEEESEAREEKEKWTGEREKERRTEGETRRLFTAFQHGTLAKAFWSKGTEDNEGGQEGEREGKTQTGKGMEEEGKFETEEVENKEREDREDCEGSAEEHVKKEKGNLFKALGVSKLTNTFSKDKGSREREREKQGDAEGTEKEERRGLWKVPGVGRLAKAFSKEELESEEKREVEELDKCESKGKFFKKDCSEKGESEVQESNSSVVVGGKDGWLTVKPPFLGLRLLKVFSRDTRKKEGRKMSEEKERMEEQETPSNWRSRKTRKARRITISRREREENQGERTVETEEERSRGGGTEQ
uniref:Rubicon Homology domain-containing protein n=1 Tax=Hucho hucho TaxID=62062 RepID=A0A4W5KJM5_9TELE